MWNFFHLHFIFEFGHNAKDIYAIRQILVICWKGKDILKIIWHDLGAVYMSLYVYVLFNLFS